LFLCPNIVWTERAVATADNPGPVRLREWRDFGTEKWLAGGEKSPKRWSRFVSVVRVREQRVCRKWLRKLALERKHADAWGRRPVSKPWGSSIARNHQNQL